MQQLMNWMLKFSVVVASLSGLALMPPIANAQNLKELFKVKDRKMLVTGFLAADPEKYRALPAAPRTRGFLPASKDLSDRFPTPAHQGDQNSCSAFAVGYAARSYYVGKGPDGTWGTQGENLASPAYIYNTLNTTGNCKTNVAVYDAIELLKSSGGLPLSAMPYQEDNCAVKATAAMLAAHAPRFRVLGHTRVEKDPTSIKSQIANNNPVIFAIDLTEEFFSWDKSVFTSSQKNGKKHAMVITGYDDARQMFKFINSWGDEWGEKGFGWISYKAVSELWIEGYTLTVGKVPQTAAVKVGQQ